MSEHFEAEYWTKRLAGISDAYESQAVVEADEADVVNSPNHYTQGDIEVIDIIRQTVAGYSDPFVGHCVATSTKYLNRAPYKHDSPLEDLKKSRAYIDFAIEHLEGKVKD